MTSSKPQSNKNSVFELGKHCSLVHTLMVSTCAVFLLTLVGWLNDPNYDVLADIAKRALGHHKDTVGLLRKPSELKYLEIRDNLNSDKTYLAVADYPSRLVASISGDTLRPLKIATTSSSIEEFLSFYEGSDKFQIFHNPKIKEVYRVNRNQLTKLKYKLISNLDPKVKSLIMTSNTRYVQLSKTSPNYQLKLRSVRPGLVIESIVNYERGKTIDINDLHKEQSPSVDEVKHLRRHIDLDDLKHKARDLETLLYSYKNKAKRTQLSVLGINLNEDRDQISAIGILIIIIVQTFFFSHLRELSRRLQLGSERLSELPWICLYREQPSGFLSTMSIAIMPPLSVILLSIWLCASLKFLSNGLFALLLFSTSLASLVSYNISKGTLSELKFIQKTARIDT